MSNSQKHGLEVERIIKERCFPGSEIKGSGTQFFDVEAIYDKENNLPTSIKNSQYKGKSTGIGLASAPKFWENTVCPYRLLVAPWVQDGSMKKTYEIREYIITPAILKDLKMGYTSEYVDGFEKEIKSFPSEKLEEARAYASEEKRKTKKLREANKKYEPILTLDQKIGRQGDQRRLQCTVRLDRLDKICPPKIYKNEYRGLMLPILVKSDRRELKSK